jgi:hypothetical protein
MNEDQREAWRRALAAKNAQQRNQRGKRKTGLPAVTRAGMVRLPAPPKTSTEETTP